MSVEVSDAASPVELPKIFSNDWKFQIEMLFLNPLRSLAAFASSTVRALSSLLRPPPNRNMLFFVVVGAGVGGGGFVARGVASLSLSQSIIEPANGSSKPSEPDV